MEDNSKVLGFKTSFMVMGFIHGLMVGATKESISRIRNMDLAFIHGPTAKNMKGTGCWASSTVKENSLTSKASHESASGSQERG